MDDQNLSDNQNPSQQDDRDVKIFELENNWKRAVADYRNLERRCNEEKEVLVKFSNFLLLERLLPILDNLESLYGHISDKGLELVIHELKDVFKGEGMEEIACLGEDFNPQFMEAVEAVEGEEGKVVEVVRKGYKMQERVLRPARVKVGKKNS